MPHYKMGKLPAKKDGVLFQFIDYFSKQDLPKPPPVFGVWQKGFTDVKMYDNNKIGNCVFVGAANETESWFFDSRKHSNEVEFTTENVVSDYAAVTGYDPRKNYDPGTDMSDAASYRRKTGIVDKNGKRHKIDAYVKLDTGDFDDLKVAMYLFGAVGIGFLMPKYAQPDFHRKRTWVVKTGEQAKTAGGHYVSGCGIDGNGDLIIMTWGRFHTVSREFYEKYNDETVGYFSIDRLIGDVSPEGFKKEKLIKDLKSLKTPFGYHGTPLMSDDTVDKGFRSV